MTKTKLRKMDILLSSPQEVYYPGQIVQGQLLIELSADMKMRGVRIKCRGELHMAWSEGFGDDEKHYSASQSYLNLALVLYGNGPESGDQVLLREGSHSFQFQLMLPQGLPGSFEGGHICSIQYWLKGSIDKPWKLDHEVMTVITVGSVLDLNTIEGAATAVKTSESKTVCCFCCESDPIKATLRLDKRGYVPGEAIVCDTEIVDGTGRGVNSAKIKLIQMVTYRTHGGDAKHEMNTCARLEHGPLRPGGINVHVFGGERLVIPPLPPTGLPGCDMIHISYLVQLTVDVMDTLFDLEVYASITIGTIPLQTTVQQSISQTGFGTDFGALTNQPVPLGAPVCDFPPPTYQECVFGKVDMTDVDDKHVTVYGVL